MNETGVFVAIDGPNGAGKTTLIRAIARRLRQMGFSVHLTKEVTRTTLGQFIRRVHKHYHGKALALLLAADRSHHVQCDIMPALRKHDFVITDRYIASSLVFQQLDGVDLSFIWRLNEGFLKPHLSIEITTSVDAVVARLATRQSCDRFEQTFSRSQEVRLFKEATSFLEKRGFKVRTFRNENVTVPVAAEELSNVLIRLRRKHSALTLKPRTKT